jgi:hypothetical protein
MNFDALGVPAGIVTGGVLTLLVFSYLLGDTPLFRFAQAVFVGVAVAYATVVAVYLVLLPKLVIPLTLDPDVNRPLFVPLILGVLLLAKLRTSWAPLGNIPIAFLFGVGSALAIGGALTGALMPQLSATIMPLSSSLEPQSFANNAGSILSNVVLVVGTIGALLSFRFTTGGRHAATRLLDHLGLGWGMIGRWFVLMAFGAIFASTAVSRVSILIGRVYYLLHDVFQLVK